MKFTNYEKNVLLVSLNHMEKHLFITEERGDITEDTCNLIMEGLKTARTKIKK